MHDTSAHSIRSFLEGGSDDEDCAPNTCDFSFDGGLSNRQHKEPQSAKRPPVVTIGDNEDLLLDCSGSKRHRTAAKPKRRQPPREGDTGSPTMMQLARRKSSNYEVVGGTGGYTSIDSSADRQGERLAKEDFNQ